VRVTAEPAGLRALTDAAALQSVLMSLVSNALRHGPPEGPVRLSARIDGGAVVVEVADEGPGLPEERLEAVFLELPDGEREEGSGLGLFLARARMRAQGGDVRLRNRESGGLVAAVRLPGAVDLSKGGR
jgi:signal transduction histidine kinase